MVLPQPVQRARSTSALGVVLLALSFALVAAPRVQSASAGSAALPLGPGCAGLPPAVAHRAGATRVVPAPSGGPQPCGVTTGFAAAESHIAVTPNGAVVYTPAVVPSGTIGTGEGAPVDPDTQGNATPAGLAVSSDDGAHWQLLKPSGVTWNPTDHGDYVDSATGRFFFENYGPIPLAPELGALQDGPAHIMWSDDLQTWHHSVIAELVLPENPKFAAAVAGPSGPRPVGYPHVVYFCANTNVGFTSPAILGRLCFRSLDGGTTWALASQLFSALVPRHPECGTSGETFSAVDGYYPEPASDGSLYVLVACGGKTYLARSTDEAATFPVVHTAAGPVTLDVPIDSITASIGNGPQLRIADDDTFYLVYPVMTGSRITKLVLRASADRGVSWSQPRDVTAPGVGGILRWAIAQRATGQLAVALLGQRPGQTTWDAYVTATQDSRAALASGVGPLFWSAQTNTQPLLFGDRIMGAGYIAGQGELSVPYPFPLGIQSVGGEVDAGNDFMGAVIATDGTVWGSYNQDCGPSPTAAGCTATHDQTRGFVGRLQFAGAVDEISGTAVRPSVPRRVLPATGASDGARLVGALLGVLGAALLRRAGRAPRGGRQPVTATP